MANKANVSIDLSLLLFICACMSVCRFVCVCEGVVLSNGMKNAFLYLLSNII